MKWGRVGGATAIVGDKGRGHNGEEALFAVEELIAMRNEE